MTPEEEMELKKLYKNTLAGRAEECGKRVKEMNREILKPFKGGKKMIKRLLERICYRVLIWRITSARRTMREAFKADEHFKYGYIANIAMLFHDRYGRGNYITNRDKRNQAAEEILDLIFKEN